MRCALQTAEEIRKEEKRGWVFGLYCEGDRGVVYLQQGKKQIKVIRGKKKRERKV